MNMKTTKHIVMRRVYYAYSFSILTSTSFWQGAILGGSVALFGRLTHVAALWQNVLQVPVGQMPQFVYRTVDAALVGGEILTVLVTALILVLSVRLTYQMFRFNTKAFRPI